MTSQTADQADTEQTETKEDVQMAAQEQPGEGTAPVQMRPQARPSGGTRPTAHPEIVRRTPEIPSAAGRRSSAGNRETEDKKLIVGREIVLSGEINSCDRLVVEGRVEANLADCREIEIAESGTFKGEAEIDIADISGHFEGSLTARDLLLVRSTGRVTGSVRFGQLEIERGGEIVGEVSAFGTRPATEEKEPSAAE